MGVLVIAAAETGAFDPDEVKLLTDLANDLAYAIGTLRARLERQQLQEEVITISEAERRRFGQELHDGLCPQLVAVRFANDMLHKKLSRAGSPLADQAAELTQNLTETVNQARNLSLLLNPVSLEVEGLMAALEKLTADSRQIYRRSVRFVCPQPVLIADNTVATHLYRIAQEAVRNDITHGQATRVTVSLRESRQAVQLTVLSNGLPFPTDLPKSTGMGLKNMRYRAQAIGAQLKISPRPGGGTAVVCTMPVNHP
ncbi:MAG: hypothetical protein HZC54_03910 [Verrucomicrobia bacterium]|nr:hypothetical protein [Verrucomicrobiota bacterium]